ncbi:MAG: hypothetical protein RMX65_012925 [Nostoc sp. DedQUE01]|nr:hypothetical protein [Nostoc sp. DedQUE11]MDZ8073311.1 hypothetical protein [Nostoc sp. DedQUE01]
MTNVWYWVKGLGIAISGAIVLSGNSAIAKVNQDVTLHKNLGIRAQNKIKIIQDANCKSAVDIQNIINRVTTQKSSLSGDRVRKICFERSIKPTQIPSKDSAENQQAQELLPIILPMKLAEEVCWYNQYGERICRAI